MLDPNQTMKIHEAADEQLALCRTGIKEYRAKIEELETAKAFYHDKWLNARENIGDMNQENATLRAQVAQLTAQRDAATSWKNALEREVADCRATIATLRTKLAKAENNKEDQ